MPMRRSLIDTYSSWNNCMTTMPMRRSDIDTYSSRNNCMTTMPMRRSHIDTYSSWNKLHDNHAYEAFPHRYLQQLE